VTVTQTNAGAIPHGSVADHLVALTDSGRKQSKRAGRRLPADFLRPNGLVYRSPYIRTRETCDLLLAEAGYDAGTGRDKAVRIYEDPLLREVEHGYEDIESQELLREKHGRFWYRYSGGESPADCYDRCCAFLESMSRQIRRKSIQDPQTGQLKAPNVLIVTHGLTIRCLVMRFFHLTVEQFDSIRNPGNAELIQISSAKDMQAPQFVSGRWGIEGLQLRSGPGEMNGSPKV
jgi:broad specificity phosphatase PhoE